MYINKKNNEKKEQNRIPRSFGCITGQILINTNVDNSGDILDIYKSSDSNTGYFANNNRTKQQSCVFVSMLRNAEIFKILNIIEVTK